MAHDPMMEEDDEHGGGGHDAAGGLRWLLTYADMITLLLGLFIILYALSSQSEARIQEVARGFQIAFGVYEPAADSKGSGIPEVGPPNTAQKADYQGIYVKISTIARQKFGQQVHVSKPNERGLTLSFIDNLFFDSDSANIKQTPKTKYILNEIAAILNNSAISNNNISIQGHTDTEVSQRFPSNWELSTARSSVIVRYLIENGSVSPERLSSEGYAQYRPRSRDNQDTPEGMARNRRVEILIQHTPDQLRNYLADYPNPTNKYQLNH